MSLTQLLNETEAEALANCDRHPIRTPGYIQQFGSLIAVDEATWKITHVAENAAEFLGQQPEALLGQDAQILLDETFMHTLRNFSSRSTAQIQRELVGKLEVGSRARDVAAHVRNGLILLEVSGDGDIPSGQSQSMDRLRWLTTRIRNESFLQDILERAVRDLRTFSGYDRVKAYRFRPDGSGEVVAEDRDETMESFLGLRFPEFDIPPTARTLYSKTPIRMICDVNGTHVPLLSTRDSDELDMSLAILRGTMPIHCDYLRNMGIGSSMSLPIVVNGDLWGLFAFHHKSPRHLGGGAALAIEFAGQFLNMAINNAVQQEAFRCELQSSDIANSLFARRDKQSASALAWNTVKDKLLDLIPASGVAFCWNGKFATHGDCPPADTFDAIAKALPPRGGEIAFSDNLLELLPDTDVNGIAGALKASVSDLPSAHVLFFRQQAGDAALWAGAPDKDIDTKGGETRLKPRSSFAAFKMEMAGRSDSWENNDVDAVAGLQRAISRAYSEAKDRDVLLENLGIVVQELHHRVRNILALVQSIVRQSRPDDKEVGAFFESLEARIISLATAHDLLTETSDHSISVREALQREAAPYQDHMIEYEGPDISIDPKAASIFVLTLHELFSNAAKYGALSERGKCLTVSWALADDGLVIQWTEQINGRLEPPQTKGFGSTLIENAFEFEFGGSSSVSFRPEGLLVEMFLPKSLLRGPGATQTHADSSLSNANDNAPTLDAVGAVLVIEDDFLIAQSMRDALSDLGYKNVFIKGSQSSAFEALANEDIQLAILDVNLGKESSGAIAHQLQKQGISFLFATGYNQSQDTVADFKQVPLLTKPVRAADLDAALKELRGGKRGG